MTPNEAVQLIDSVIEVWPNPPLGEIAAEAWLAALAPLDFQAARIALRDLVATEAFRPTPAAVAERASGSGWDRAWMAVVDLMRSRGSYPTGDELEALPAATLLAVRRAGGWRHLCSMSADDGERAFRRSYRSDERSPDPVLAALPSAVKRLDAAS